MCKHMQELAAISRIKMHLQARRQTTNYIQQLSVHW